MDGGLRTCPIVEGSLAVAKERAESTRGERAGDGHDGEDEEFGEGDGPEVVEPRESLVHPLLEVARGADEDDGERGERGEDAVEAEADAAEGVAGVVHGGGVGLVERIGGSRVELVAAGGGGRERGRGRRESARRRRGCYRTSGETGRR